MAISITPGNSPHDVNNTTETGDTVFSGGILQVTTLGTISATDVASGGAVLVGGAGQNLATSIDTVVFSGGTESVQKGGTSFFTSVFSEGTQGVFSGGVANNTLVDDSEFVGTVFTADFDHDALQLVGPGGVADGTTVINGGLQAVSGGTANGTVLAGGGNAVETNTGPFSFSVSGAFTFSEQAVFAGGVANGTVVDGNGDQSVWGTGTANNTIVNGFGIEVVGVDLVGVASGGVGSAILRPVGGGGTTNDTLVTSGGTEFVFSGGVANGTLVTGGGDLEAFFGAVTSDATLVGTSANPANEFVHDGGLAVNTTVEQFGVLDIGFLGLASGTQVDSGGSELVVGGTSTKATILAGGQELVWDDGVTFGANVSGGLQVVEGPATGFVPGSALATTVNGGDLIDFGFVSGTKVNSGFEVVWSGGVSDNETINSKGFNFVVGATSGDTLSGGTEFVVSGGLADGTTVDSSGVEVVSTGSEAEFTLINHGGNELVFSGGLDVSATVAGAQTILSGGTASGADITAGGLELVEAGGTTVNALIDGGVLEVRSGGSAPVVSFSTDNGGLLVLDSSQTFTGLVAGFSSPPTVSEAIDLTDISFGAGTKVTFTEAAGNLSGTLTVTSGSETASLTLLGQYTTANFTASSDGHGGTLIKDPAVTAAASVATPQHA